MAIAAARGRWVIMGDADDSYDFAELAPFVLGYERATTWSTATGSRAASGRARCRGCTGGSAIRPLVRRAQAVRDALRRHLLRPPRLRPRKVAALDIRSSGMEFAIEMIVKATMMGLRVTEVPTTLSPDAEGREPHLNTWRDGWRSIRLLLLYSPKWLFLYPGLLLLALGVAGMAWLVPEQRSIGSVTFDVRPCFTSLSP